MEVLQGPILTDRKCTGCSRVYRVTENSKQKYCSRNCQYMHSHATNNKELKARQKQEGISVLFDKRIVHEN